MRRTFLTCLLALLWAGSGASGLAATAVGDWGHFLSFNPRLHLNNPDGRAFAFTIHLMRWPIAGWGWNAGEWAMTVTGPAGKVLMDGRYRVEDSSRTFNVPAGAKGVYMFDVGKKGEMVNFWLESTLARSVVWTGKPSGRAFENRWLVTQCSVPRRWWFWVPEGAKEFTCRAQRDTGNTEREDFGITVFSPRGQRLRAMWGQPWLLPDAWPGGKRFRGEMSVRVPVEPGTAGRFWYLEVRLGDSHNYSNINLTLDGVPPYVARSPEEWFDPETGKAAPVKLYDDSRFMQSKRDESLKWQHWSPSPSLGDPDGVQIRGNARFALWNPDRRELRLDICDYLVRKDTPEAAVPVAAVKVVDQANKQLFDRQVAVPHHHHSARDPFLLPASATPVTTVSVANAARWFAYTYPALPTVWIGAPADDGFSRFTLEVGTARNWYFYVPRGVTRFEVRARCEHDTDVAHLEINAPDRTQAMIYGREGAATVRVPAGLDGKIWHLRTDVGSATRMITAGGQANYRRLGLYLTLEVKGVPGLLSPTWEQWFDPARPRRALRREAK